MKKLFLNISKHQDKLILLILASLQVLINFSISFLVVQKIGFGAELDIYYIALAVFGFLMTSIGWSISAVLTPILIENKEKNIRGEMFINVFFISIMVFLLAISSMFLWTNIIFKNYTALISINKIYVIQGIFIVTFFINTLNIVFLAIFQEKNEYIKINSINMLGAIVGFSFVYITIESYGIYSAVLSQLLIQLFLFLILGGLTFKYINKNGFRYNKQTFLLLWNRMKYMLFGSLYYRTDELIDRFIASYLTVGFLSLIGFIQRVYGAIITVLNTSIAGPTITKFSNLIKEKNYKSVKSTLFKYLILLFLIDSLIFLLVLFFGEELFLYFFSERIALNLLSVLSSIIIILFIIVFSKTLGMIQKSLLMSANQEKAVTIISSTIFSFNIFFKILATYLYGIKGFLVVILLNELSIILVQFIYINKVILNENNI